MNRAKETDGFTLIELLIVVVILGILVAIAIPRFAMAKGKAFDGTAKSDLRNAMTAQEAHYADNQTYASDVADLDFEPSTNVTVTIEVGDESGFTMTAEHAQGRCWEVDSANGVVELRADDC